jgi:hypothetical protein
MRDVVAGFVVAALHRNADDWMLHTSRASSMCQGIWCDRERRVKII